MSKQYSDDSCAFSFSPLNEAQRLAWDLALKNDLCCFLGVAGSGKTTVALALAVHFFRKHRRKILIIRPCIEAGPTLGFLPGELDEKTAPYREVIDQLLGKMVHRLPEDALLFRAPGYLRGSNFENATVIIDEAQNLTYAQLKMLCTRMCNGCKIILVGDPDQTDIKPTISGYDCDLDYLLDQIDDIPGVGITEFLVADCVRHPLVKQILKRL